MELLELLTQTPSVPGRESRIRQVIADHLAEAKLVDEMHVDPLGSLLTIRKPRGAGAAQTAPQRVMLAAHMDQIGFLVSHIHGDGTLRVNPVGGFDPRNLFARKVRVCAASGDLMGVMNPGGKPIHISSPEERKKVPEINEFYIDLGMSGEQVGEQVKLGDMVVLDGPFHTVGDYVSSQCLDNRVGCWAQLRALEQLGDHACEIHAVWTVQEEVGLRGAVPASYRVQPDIAIACDTTLCCQTPGVPEEQRVSVAGGGVALHVMDSSAISDLGLIEEMEALAETHQIPVQRALLARGGQDGAAMQRARTGARMVAMACPIKHIHTVTEMAHRTDLAAYVALLTAFLQSL
ncbi:MAG: M20/M25/M40 family metallo-hydrolase [Planctomycetales bacterium]|nr:M20/M25/M40 family metallo-hydrolase [Planctomycetales bacterium]